MKKNFFRRLVAQLRAQQGGFSRIKDNPAGTKMAKKASGYKNRGCDGTLRR